MGTKHNKLMKNTPSVDYGISNFWFDRESVNIEDTDIQRLLNMAEIQRAISNFVQIVSPKQVPVTFRGKDSFTDHDEVVIASVADKNFDSTVGLALHEASHIRWTELKPVESNKLIAEYVAGRVALNSVYFKAPNTILSSWTHESNINELRNWIEDRRIDEKSQSTSPGYIGYYEAMYDRYFRSPFVNAAVASSKYRKPDNIDHYFFRIINFMSPKTDLKALPGLELIWNIIDLKNISRLPSSFDSIELAAKVYDIILSYWSKAVALRQNPKPKKQPKPKKSNQTSNESDSNSEPNPDDIDDSDDKRGSNDEDSDDEKPKKSSKKKSNKESDEDSEEKESKKKSKKQKESDEDSDDESELARHNRNGDYKPEEDEKDSDEEDSNNKTSAVSDEKSKSTDKPTDEEMEDEIQEALDAPEEDDLSERKQKQAEKAFAAQKNFMNGVVDRDKVTEKDKIQLELLEKMKARYVPVEVRDLKGNLIKIDVMLVEHIPVNGFEVDSNSKVSAEDQIKKNFGDNSIIQSIFRFNDYRSFDKREEHKAVQDGMKLGRILGSKLRIRTEERTLKTTRQSGGRIDKRILHLSAAGIENLFCSLKMSQFNKGYIHITIDASGSMGGDKFLQCLKTAAAIATAADMVKNINVVVTVRTNSTATTENKPSAYRRRGRRYSRRSSTKTHASWPCVAVIYNSKRDKLNKILKVWPWLCTAGSTPEAICYGAERELMTKGSAGVDSYFITLTDGAPGDSGTGKNVNGENVSWSFGVKDSDSYIGEGNIDAKAHTKFQIEQMKKDGISTLAFFISSMEKEKIDSFNAAPEDDKKEMELGYSSSRFAELRDKYGYYSELVNFRKCYGKDGVAIDTENLSQLARALNNLFLKGNPFQS